MKLYRVATHFMGIKIKLSGLMSAWIILASIRASVTAKISHVRKALVVSLKFWFRLMALSRVISDLKGISKMEPLLYMTMPETSQKCSIF
jgi:hypothetical protein